MSERSELIPCNTICIITGAYAPDNNYGHVVA